MGWLWSSNKAPSTNTPPTPNTSSPESFDPPTQTPTPSDSSPSPSPSSDSTTAKPHALESAQPPSQPVSSPTPHDPSSSSSLITPSTTLPSTISCRSAFDAAFYCQSLGGQFANVYRYGSLRGCSQHWGDFWFCVRTNKGLMSEERRVETVQAWALNREREKYGKGKGDVMEGGGSSEDVWEARRWKVRGAFQGDWGVLEKEARERADLEMQEERER